MHIYIYIYIVTNKVEAGKGKIWAVAVWINWAVKNIFSLNFINSSY